jgi:hypothetical protein
MNVAATQQRGFLHRLIYHKTQVQILERRAADGRLRPAGGTNSSRPLGNVFLYHRTLHYATSRQAGETRESKIERTPIQVNMTMILMELMSDA